MVHCEKCDSHTERYNNGACKPCKNAYDRSLYASQRKKRISQVRTWQRANLDKERQRDRKRYRANPSLWVKRKIKRRRKLADQTPLLSLADKSRIEELYHLSAQLGSTWHVDHITPLSKGGLHHPDNLQVIRATENWEKHTRMDFTPKISVTIS